MAMDPDADQWTCRRCVRSSTVVFLGSLGVVLLAAGALAWLWPNSAVPGSFLDARGIPEAIASSAGFELSPFEVAEPSPATAKLAGLGDGLGSSHSHPHPANQPCDQEQGQAYVTLDGPGPDDSSRTPAMVLHHRGLAAEQRSHLEGALASYLEAAELDPEDARHLSAAGRVARLLGRLDQAEELYGRALVLEEDTFGPEHARVSAALTNLARVHGDQGRYEDAEVLLQRAVTMEERVRGPLHTQVATVLSELAYLYQRQGRTADAVPLLVSALAIQEDVSGRGDSKVAARASALGSLLQEDGQMEAARPYLEQALSTWEGLHGVDHPQTAIGLTDLGTVYRVQGRLDEAEPLLTRALSIREAAFGPGTLPVATQLTHLGLLYLAQGRYDEARPLYERALAIELEHRGSVGSHAARIQSLAAAAASDGRPAEAEHIYQMALGVSEQVLGREHAGTVFFRREYDQFLRNAGRL